MPSPVTPNRFGWEPPDNPEQMGRLVAILDFWIDRLVPVVCDCFIQVFRFPGQTLVFAAKIERPGPLLYEKHEDRETGPASF
jgi:hypothetical protein